MIRFYKVSIRLALVCLLLIAPGLQAQPASSELPTGGVITSGTGSIATDGSAMTVTQNSDQLWTTWDSFNIGTDASVTFDQPGRDSVAFNTIVDQNPSQIFGSLSANGQVFLLNTSGLVFGQTAQVDVAGLVASSLDLAAADPANGDYSFANATDSGLVSNLGTITTGRGGIVALLGSQVSNEGTIRTPQGSTALLAGNEVTLDFAGDGLIAYAVERGAVDAQANQGGLIQADGGLVVMNAVAADELSSSVINHSGIIEAQGMVEREGRIVLDGDQVYLTGTLDVSSIEGQGGTITVTGDVIDVQDAQLDASGAMGGGEIYVGGGWQGSDPDLRNATTVVVDEDVTVTADATTQGDGGTVVFWSDESTTFAGDISVRGGDSGGNGGQVEVSGKHDLLYTGYTDARAPLGTTGDLLLDPDTINIVDGGTGAGAIDGATVYEADLEAQGANVTLSSTGNVTLGDLTTDGVLAMQNNVGLSITAGSDGSGSYYTTDTDDEIRLTGTGELYIRAGNTGSGSVTSGKITTGTGKVTLWGADGLTVGNTITTNGGDVELWGDSDNMGGGTLTLNQSITTMGGDVDLDAGSGGVYVNADISTSAGRLYFDRLGTTWNATYRLAARLVSTGDVDINQNLQFGSGAEIDTTGTLTFQSTSSMQNSGASLILTASAFDFQQDITGNSGTITLKPYSANTNVDIGSAGTGNMTISSANLGRLSGFANVTIGRSDGTGTTKVVSDSTVAASDTFTLKNATVNVTGGTLANTSGDIALIGNVVDVSKGVTANSGNGTITLQQLTAANTLTLGADIENADIANLNAGTLVVGRSDGGALTISSDITNTAATVHLKSGSTVTASAGAIDATNLAVTAGGGATLTDSSFNYTNLALNVGGDTTVTREAAVTFGNIDSVNGLVIGNSGTTSVTINSTGSDTDITLGAPVAKSGSGDASLYLKATGDVIQAASTAVTASAGELDVVYNADTDTNGGGVILGQGTSITTNGGNLVMGGGTCTTTAASAAAIGTGVAGTAGILMGSEGGSDVSINVGGGSILLWGQGPTAGGAGVRLYGVNMDSGSAGTVNIRGDGVYVLTDSGNGHGIVIQDTSTIRGGSGGMTLTANANVNTGGQWSYPLWLGSASGESDGATRLYTTNGGTMTLALNAPAATGTAGSNYYLYGNGTIGHASQNGNVAITATGNSTAGLGLLTLNVASGNLTISGNRSVSATSATIAVGGTTDVQAGGSSYDIDLSSSSIDLTGAFTASSVDDLTLLDSDTLILGAITANGAIDIATTTGDLTVTGDITTTNTTSSALVLNAGKATAAGTSTGGDLIVTGSPTLSVGSGGRATLYSGDISDSSGLSTLVGSGSGNFRYNSDETTTNYSTALSTGTYAIYREQPTLSITADDEAITYGATPSLSTTLTGGQVNGDTEAQAISTAASVSVSGSTSTAGKYTVGAHTLTPSSAASGLGYAFSYTSGSLIVSKKTLTVSGLSADNKTYDGTTTGTVTGGSLSGLESGDSVSFGTAATFADKNVGTGKTVTLDYSISGTDSGNYNVTDSSDTANITAKALTMTGSSAANKVYDGATTATISQGSLSGFVGSETVTATNSGTFADKNVGTSKTVTVAYTLADGTNGGLASNYSLASDSLSANITAKPLTVTGSVAADKLYDGDTDTTVTVGSLTGFVGSETVTATGAGNFSDAAVGLNKDVTVAYSLADGTNGGLASNYSLASQTLQADITELYLYVTTSDAQTSDAQNDRGSTPPPPTPTPDAGPMDPLAGLGDLPDDSIPSTTLQVEVTWIESSGSGQSEVLEISGQGQDLTVNGGAGFGDRDVSGIALEAHLSRVSVSLASGQNLDIEVGLTSDGRLVVVVPATVTMGNRSQELVLAALGAARTDLGMDLDQLQQVVIQVASQES